MQYDMVNIYCWFLALIQVLFARASDVVRAISVFVTKNSWMPLADKKKTINIKKRVEKEKTSQ
jgi:hypothetical protein